MYLPSPLSLSSTQSLQHDWREKSVNSSTASASSPVSTPFNREEVFAEDYNRFHDGYRSYSSLKGRSFPSLRCRRCPSLRVSSPPSLPSTQSIQWYDWRENNVNQIIEYFRENKFPKGKTAALPEDISRLGGAFIEGANDNRPSRSTYHFGSNNI